MISTQIKWDVFSLAMRILEIGLPTVTSWKFCGKIIIATESYAGLHMGSISYSGVYTEALPKKGPFFSGCRYM